LYEDRLAGYGKQQWQLRQQHQASTVYSINNNNNNNTGAPICKQEERKPRTWKTRKASIHEQRRADLVILLL